MRKLNLIVLVLASLMLANTPAPGQVRNSPTSAAEHAATAGSKMIELARTAQASRTTYLRLYCTPDGNSHFQSVTGDLRATNFAPPAAPLFIGGSTPASTMFFGGSMRDGVLMIWSADFIIRHPRFSSSSSLLVIFRSRRQMVRRGGSDPVTSSG